MATVCRKAWSGGATNRSARCRGACSSQASGCSAAAVFVSLGSDPVLWLVLALGPALLAVAARLQHAVTVDPGHRMLK